MKKSEEWERIVYQFSEHTSRTNSLKSGFAIQDQEQGLTCSLMSQYTYMLSYLLDNERIQQSSFIIGSGDLAIISAKFLKNSCPAL